MKNSYDVIVVGGGIAGVSASLSAKREGLSVLLIEKTSLLGGLATIGLINWFEPLCDGKGKQIIFGISEELIRLACENCYHTCDDSWFENSKGKNRFCSSFDHRLFALKLTKLLNDEGIDLVFESYVSDILLCKNQIKSIEISTIDGKKNVEAKFFIDASGTACLCKYANLPLRYERNFLSFATINYKEGLDRPKLDIKGANLFGNGHPKQTPYFDHVDFDETNRYIISSHYLALAEFKDKQIGDLPSMPQFRKIRSLVGEYTLSEKDKNIDLIDSVGKFVKFNNVDATYTIPYRALYNKDVINLFVAGRIISSSDDGWEATRVIPVCALTGEISGLAASMCIKSFRSNHELNIKSLQNALKERNIITF